MLNQRIDLKSHPKLILLSRVSTAILAVVIAVLTLVPREISGAQGSDKAYHFIAFAALAFPLAFAGQRPVSLIFLAAVAYGGMIEVLQPLTGRTADSADLFADALGALFGVVLGLYLGRVFRRLRAGMLKGRGSDTLQP
jgi:VanZ family protein